MRKKQKKTSRKQGVYLFVRFALWILSLIIFIGIYDSFAESPNYEMFALASVMILALITIAVLFAAYCPKCKWVLTFRIFGSLFVEWGRYTYFCPKCEKRGQKTKPT